MPQGSVMPILGVPWIFDRVQQPSTFNLRINRMSTNLWGEIFLMGVLIEAFFCKML